MRACVLFCPRCACADVHVLFCPPSVCCVLLLCPCCVLLCVLCVVVLCCVVLCCAVLCCVCRCVVLCCVVLLENTRPMKSPNTTPKKMCGSSYMEKCTTSTHSWRIIQVTQDSDRYRHNTCTDTDMHTHAHQLRDGMKTWNDTDTFTCHIHGIVRMDVWTWSGSLALVCARVCWCVPRAHAFSVCSCVCSWHPGGPEILQVIHDVHADGRRSHICMTYAHVCSVLACHRDRVCLCSDVIVRADSCLFVYSCVCSYVLVSVVSAPMLPHAPHMHVSSMLLRTRTTPVPTPRMNSMKSSTRQQPRNSWMTIRLEPYKGMIHRQRVKRK